MNSFGSLRDLYFQRNPDGTPNPERDEALVRGIIERAKRIVSHPSRPRKTIFENFLLNPHGELDIEASLENSPFLDQPEELLVERSEEQVVSFLTILDCSSSMNGEKHLLASIAVAVLFLNGYSENIGLSLFASTFKTLKAIGQAEAPDKTILRFLKTPPRGFTNIHLGLKEGLKQLRSTTKKKIALLASDGKSTEGDEPYEIARQYDFLLVLHMRGPGCDIEASKKIAQAGHGFCVEVKEFEELPRKIYEAVRMINRLA